METRRHAIELHECMFDDGEMWYVLGEEGSIGDVMREGELNQCRVAEHV